MERSIRFNNAGVDCIEAGFHKVAWDLFKGALEVKLAAERTGTLLDGCRGSKAENVGHLPNVPNNNSYIEKAETHLMNLDRYVSSDDRHGQCQCSPGPLPSSSNPTIAASTNNRNVSSSSISNTISLYQPGSYESDTDLQSPFLFARALRLQQSSTATTTSTNSTEPPSTRRESATIIFNLALVDHLKNRCSEQAVALYELAMTLLAGDRVDLLGISLMNNIGVWCYENGDMDGSLVCMGHLSSFIGSCDAFINQEQKDGVHANILWLMNPPFAASPAA